MIEKYLGWYLLWLFLSSVLDRVSTSFGEDYKRTNDTTDRLAGIVFGVVSSILFVVGIYFASTKFAGYPAEIGDVVQKGGVYSVTWQNNAHALIQAEEKPPFLVRISDGALPTRFVYTSDGKFLSR